MALGGAVEEASVWAMGMRGPGRAWVVGGGQTSIASWQRRATQTLHLFVLEKAVAAQRACGHWRLLKLVQKETLSLAPCLPRTRSERMVRQSGPISAPIAFATLIFSEGGFDSPPSPTFDCCTYILLDEDPLTFFYVWNLAFVNYYGLRAAEVPKVPCTNRNGGNCKAEDVPPRLSGLHELASRELGPSYDRWPSPKKQLVGDGLRRPGLLVRSCSRQP